MLQGRPQALFFTPRIAPHAAGVLLSAFALIGWILLTPLSAGSVQTPQFKLQGVRGEYFFVLDGLTEEVLTTVSRQSDLSSIVEVYVSGIEEPVPPLLGGVSIVDGLITFHPRYPLQSGLTYRVQFEPGTAGLDSLTAEFAIPADAEQPRAEIIQIYPTAPVLPENLLKFYLHFSAPMSRGDVYRYIRLFQDEAEVELPFLEIEQELWDSDHRRLTLLIDPGRIKRGLVPHKEAGTALVKGQSYRLVIDSGWQDATGNPLRAGFEKIFRVAKSDRIPPDPEQWILSSPGAGGTGPLRVEFGEPMDQALAMRLLQVEDSSGSPLAGSVTMAEEESVWIFCPDDPWAAGEYTLSFAKTLEDLAGNRIGRPFEVDVFEPVQERVVKETVSLPFRIQPER